MEWSGNWLIGAHNGYDDKPPVDMLNYPAIKKHLDSYYEVISSREDQGLTAYNLRNCNYYAEFKKPKILWGNLSDKPKFMLDKNNFYAVNSVYFLTGSRLELIISILNSKIIKWYFDQISTKSGKGTNMWTRYKVECLPVCEINSEKTLLIEKKVGRILNDPSVANLRLIDDLVGNLYNLTKEEIDIVNKSWLN